MIQEQGDGTGNNLQAGEGDGGPEDATIVKFWNCLLWCADAEGAKPEEAILKLLLWGIVTFMAVYVFVTFVANRKFGTTEN